MQPRTRFDALAFNYKLEKCNEVLRRRRSSTCVPSGHSLTTATVIEGIRGFRSASFATFGFLETDSKRQQAPRRRIQLKTEN